MSTVEPVEGTTARIPVLPGRRRRLTWRRLLKVVLGLVIVVVLATGVLRVTSLWGLPDAPEPFDAAAYTSATIPDASNAIVAFDEARRKLGGERERNVFNSMQQAPKGNAAEKPEILAWVEANRPAMEIWRAGTDRPDAMPTDPRVPRWSDVLPDPHLPSWLRVAAIEASRLEEAGDLEGAWRWHKARLRATLLSSLRRGVHTRFFAARTFREVSLRDARRLGEEPKMRKAVPLLRRALADVEAMPLHGTEADSLKTDYLALSGRLRRLRRP